MIAEVLLLAVIVVELAVLIWLGWRTVSELVLANTYLKQIAAQQPQPPTNPAVALKFTLGTPVNQ